MSVTLELLVAIVGLASIGASGAALYVSMKLKNELLAFRCEFLAELDNRFLRSREYAKDTLAIATEEKQYRLDARERIGTVEVEVVKVRDSNNELREIVVKMHPQTPKKQTR